MGRFPETGAIELAVGQVLRFDPVERGAVACRAYAQWTVIRIFEGADQRPYVRLKAVKDVTVTKIVARHVLRRERFVISAAEAVPSDVLSTVVEASLPFRSRRAKAAARWAVAAAAE